LGTCKHALNPLEGICFIQVYTKPGTGGLVLKVQRLVSSDSSDVIINQLSFIVRRCSSFVVGDCCCRPAVAVVRRRWSSSVVVAVVVAVVVGRRRRRLRRCKVIKAMNELANAAHSLTHARTHARTLWRVEARRAEKPFTLFGRPLLLSSKKTSAVVATVVCLKAHMLINVRVSDVGLSLKGGCMLG